MQAALSKPRYQLLVMIGYFHKFNFNAAITTTGFIYIINKTNVRKMHIYLIIYHPQHDPWGQKAHDVLKHTRGKGFRHEKTKRKRGGYRYK